jgi:hypothetical protein
MFLVLLVLFLVSSGMMPTHAQKNSAVRVLPPIKRAKSAAFGPSDCAAGLVPACHATCVAPPTESGGAVVTATGDAATVRGRKSWLANNWLARKYATERSTSAACVVKDI